MNITYLINTYIQKLLHAKIEYINKIYDEGNFIIDWTSRGNASGID